MSAYKDLSRYYLFKNVSITAALSGTGVAAGLIVDALILSAFGVGYQTDALFAALALPLLLNSVFSIQCPKVLIPIFTEYFSRNGEADAWTLLSNLLTSCFVVLVGIAVIGMALSGIIMPLQIPGLESKTISLAAGLSRILFWLVVSQGLAAVLQSVLYARHSYVISSSGKLVSNIATIIVVAITYGQFGIQAVAVGMILGSCIQVGLLSLVLFRNGFRYRYVLNLTDPKMREILKAFRYTFSGHILGESGTIIQNLLGSFLGAGSITVMRYASRIVQAISGILLGSVVQVTLPLIARHAALKDLGAQRKALLESIRLLCVISLPISIWLMLMAHPLVVLLFERGQFSSADAVLTAVLIQFMVPDIILGRLVSVSQTVFYSNMDMRTPLISTVIYTLANTMFGIVLVHFWGVVGLPIAVSLASLSNTVYMTSRLQKRFGPMDWAQMRGFAFRLTATCAVGGVGLAFGTKVAAITVISESLVKVLNVAVPTALGMCAFIMGAFLFRLIDTRFLLPIAGRAS